MGSCIPPNLGDSGPLVFDIFFLHFWNSNYTYIRQLDIVSQVTEILFIFFNHFLHILPLNNFHKPVFTLTLLCSAAPFWIRSIPWMHLIILNPGLTLRHGHALLDFNRKLYLFILEFNRKLYLFMVFPVVMYRCESWTIKKAERQRIDTFELWCWRRLLRDPWTARTSNQSILKEINCGILWKD